MRKIEVFRLLQLGFFLPEKEGREGGREKREGKERRKKRGTALDQKGFESITTKYGVLNLFGSYSNTSIIKRSFETIGGIC